MYFYKHKGRQVLDLRASWIALSFIWDSNRSLRNETIEAEGL